MLSSVVCRFSVYFRISSRKNINFHTQEPDVLDAVIHLVVIFSTGELNLLYVVYLFVEGSMKIVVYTYFP
jgi:hypothetical protein